MLQALQQLVPLAVGEESWLCQMGCLFGYCAHCRAPRHARRGIDVSVEDHGGGR